MPCCMIGSCLPYASQVSAAARPLSRSLNRNGQSRLATLASLSAGHARSAERWCRRSCCSFRDNAGSWLPDPATRAIVVRADLPEMPHPPQSFIDHDGSRLLGSPRPSSSDLTLPHDAGLNRPAMAESSMSVGMVRMDLTRRLNAHRTLNLTVSFLALVGWGAFASSAGSSASAERHLRAALAQSQVAQDQLRAERDQQL